VDQSRIERELSCPIPGRRLEPFWPRISAMGREGRHLLQAWKTSRIVLLRGSGADRAPSPPRGAFTPTPPPSGYNLATRGDVLGGVGSWDSPPTAALSFPSSATCPGLCSAFPLKDAGLSATTRCTGSGPGSRTPDCRAYGTPLLPKRPH